MDVINFTVMEVDYGNLVLVARNGLLWRLDLISPKKSDAGEWVRAEFPRAVEAQGPFVQTLRLLDRYFAGQKVDFDTPVDLKGLGAFTTRVLMYIRQIPYGKLTHYGNVAKNMGYPNAARAVGQALKRNPIPIVIPCHRIIRGDGSLGGFDMGLDVKTRLLSLEGISVDKMRTSMIFS